MIKVKFDHKVKYKEKFMTAHEPFDIDDKDADKMVALGAFILKPAPTGNTGDKATEATHQDKSLSNMNINEIRAYAESKGISLEGMTKRDEMIAEIKNHSDK